MATIKDYSPEDQQKIKDYIKSSGGMADFGTATLVLKVKPTSGGRSSSGSSSGGSSGGLNYQPSSALDTNNKGWYVTPEGKRLNPKYYDEYGNRLITPKATTSKATTSNNTNTIDKQYDQRRKSLVAQLRASIAKAKGSYTDIISKAPQTFQPLRNQTELTKEQQLRSALERNAATGDRGGIGRQDLLGINTTAGNQMNDINLQQQNVINDANTAITGLDEQAAFEESAITSDIAAQKLRDLLAEQTRIDELGRDQERYSQEYSDRQKQQEFNNSNTLADREAEQADKALRTEIETMGRYYSDFQAEINRRQSTGDKTDDALIPYLQAARAEKIAKQLADADNSASQAYKNAYNMWLQLGVATPEVAKILGIEAGAKTLDKVKAEYSTSKPYYNPNTGGGGDNSSGGGGSEVPWYLR
jgi:hypothetical protein